MRLRHPKLSSVMAWTITFALTLAPVMAQSPPDTGSAGIQAHKEEVAELPKDGRNPIVDISVLPELPVAATAPAFQDVSRNSTPAAAPDPVPAPTKPGGGVEPGGKSKWTIMAALIIAGTVAGVILLLHFTGGDDKPKPTIITAGTPTVSVPNH
jgi:hypothetical protein